MTKKKILLLIFDGFCEFEVTTAISILRDSFELNTVSFEGTTLKSEAGLNVVADYKLKNINIHDYEALILPGFHQIEEQDDLFNFIRVFAGEGKIIGAICSGPYLLAKAGLLANVPYTVTLSKLERKELGFFNEDNFVYRPTVRHNNILTAQGHAYAEFGIELAKMLKPIDEQISDFYRGVRNYWMEDLELSNP